MPTSLRTLALLRGINVGGNRKVPMKDLVTVFADTGCTDVETYIQSGTVVFRTRAGSLPRLGKELETAIAKRFGFEVPLVLVPGDELETIVERNPFLAQGVAADKVHVGFLAASPAGARVASLDHRRSPPDEFVVRDRAVYLHLPNGVARSKLTNDYFDSKLATTITIRNLRTVQTLLGLAQR